MGQLSFFSAESVPPAVTDLSGLLAGPGQVVTSAGRARISAVVDAQWRARAVAAAIEECGLTAEIARSEEGHPLVRTDAVLALAPLASQWTKGAVKAAPRGWVPGPRELRIWALAAGYGENDGERFVLGLDPHASDTYSALAESLIRAGIAPTLIGTRGNSPGLRIVGRRRLTRLAENIGEPPADIDPEVHWPTF
ncbi:hypothetical protein [Antrihabitans cavernicola]|uniref:Uncharacterized protein n=1 Tax=Antrihabitans cavernicola TaxID=2495913 RepID=A0A5A7SFU6_9NOCA|nr:hypothetical protein [Spelaeibacter cavernicola]KAA0024444.1 hypothetical protein FOY51_00280 [Spelaeibacter cavernicola]